MKLEILETRRLLAAGIGEYPFVSGSSPEDALLSGNWSSLNPDHASSSRVDPVQLATPVGTGDGDVPIDVGFLSPTPSFQGIGRLDRRDTYALDIAASGIAVGMGYTPVLP